MNRLNLIVLLLALSAAELSAQQQDSTRRDTAQVIAPVRVTVTRDAARPSLELPFAITRVMPDSTRPGLRRANVGELLLGVPGVQVQDRANPAQDPRIAIRGFGARSAFGVRGVRIMRDGIPLTLPDGQTPTDWLELESVGDVEIIRGTAAALYGNAAGGVVNFRSRDISAQPVRLELRNWNGGGLLRTSLQGSGSASERTGWQGSLSHTSGNGAREWSTLRATNGFARVRTSLASTWVELQGQLYDMPRAENTGALTASELARDPRIADSLNVLRNSRKAVQHTQLSLRASRGEGANVFEAVLFGGTRALDNPLPFAIVDVQRKSLGASVRATWRTEKTGWPLRIGAGVDAQHQLDDRANFENCSEPTTASGPTVRCPQTGAERGAVRLDQQERVSGVGSYVRTEVEAPKRIFASAAVRFDAVAFRVRDRFLSNGDDSGDRQLNAVTPMFGLVWRAADLWLVYGNLSSAFETPTITELTNQVDGTGGLNTSLEPQLARSAEVGVQGVLWSRVRMDVAAFRTRVRDELVPFDVPDQPGRRAFRNAGRSVRDGIEVNASTSLSFADVGVTHTYSRFRFVDYVVGTSNYSGNEIPGTPSQLLQLYATTRLRGAYLTVEGTASSRVSASDNATVQAAGYASWNARVGFSAITYNRLRIEPTASIDNVFDRRYAGAVVINATRERYFEPGLPRRLSLLLRAYWY